LKRNIENQILINQAQESVLGRTKETFSLLPSFVYYL